MKKLLLATAVLAASSTAFAAGPQYNYLQGQWQESEVDGSNVDLDGFGVAASIDLNKEFFAFGQYASVDDRGVDVDRFAIGAAYKMPLSTRTDLNFGLGIVSYDFDPDFRNDDDTGLLLTGGIRSQFTQEIELGASLSYEDAYDIDLLATLYGAYHFNSKVSAGVSLTTGDIDTTALYVRVAF